MSNVMHFQSMIHRWSHLNSVEIEPQRRRNTEFIEHMLHARYHGWNLTNVIYLIPNITQEVVTMSLILQMKLWLTQDRWAVKQTKQDSTRSHLLFLLHCLYLEQFCSFSFASISPITQLQRLRSRFLQHCWKLKRWNIRLRSSSVALSLWKMSWCRQEAEQFNWEMTER